VVSGVLASEKFLSNSVDMVKNLHIREGNKLLKKEKKSANNNFSKFIARLALARRTHGMYVRK